MASLEESIRKVFGSLSEEHFEKNEYGEEDSQRKGLVFEEFYSLYDPTGVQAMVSFMPEEKKATVYLFAFSLGDDLSKIIGNLQALEKRYSAFSAKGLPISTSILVHEDETSTVKEYQIEIPVSTQKELDTIVYALKEVG